MLHIAIIALFLAEWYNMYRLDKYYPCKRAGAYWTYELTCMLILSQSLAWIS